MVGQTNSGIFKGLFYENEYRVINEKHQFFESNDFRYGSVVYYGQRYSGIELRYDVYLENLLVINEQLANKPIMMFDKNGVTEFEIDGNSFKQLSNNPVADAFSGFFQVLLERDSLTLYKKLRKKIFKRTDQQVVYYEFKNVFSYLMYSGGIYYPFERVRQLNRFFPTLKKQIKAGHKKNGALKNSSYDDYTKKVLLDLFHLNATREQEEL